MASSNLFTIGENVIPFQFQNEGVFDRPSRNCSPQDNIWSTSTKSNHSTKTFPTIQYVLTNEQKTEEYHIPSQSRIQTQTFVTKSREQKAEEFVTKSRGPLQELKPSKYTNNNIDNRRRNNDETYSKYKRSNVAMTLWTIDELKTFLNRNDLQFNQNKNRPYYYRLAAMHRGFQENIQEKRILQQQVMALSQSIKDIKMRQIEDKMRGVSLNTSEKQLNTQQYKYIQNENDANCNMNENQFKKLMQSQHDIRSLKQENQTLRNENTLYLKKMNQQNYEMEQIQIKHKQMDNMNKQTQRLQNEIDQQNHEIVKLREQCNWYQQKARKDEDTRKRLHNKIQELKGNIRVFCRVRPLFEKQDAIFEIEDDIETQSITLLTPCTMNSYSISRKSNKDTRYSFSFDRVFAPSANQDVVFNDISELVQSALDGYKVCIFAYGQTGSGKTFTMNGASLNKRDENRGMIPRSMEQIFEYKERLKEKGWEYKCIVSYLEIYNEKIMDLLVENKKNNYKYHQYFGGCNETPQYLDIHQKKTRNGSNHVYVDGAKEIEVSSSFDVYSLLTLASKNRSVGRTDCNERSSRSHTVFQLYLNGYNSVNGQKTRGVLNLIDLAGSERLKKSNATGIQLKETQNINRSLSCLGDVIAALSSKKTRSHIPYRNSKLTYLLMNYFGGDAKTLMFVNLCPEKDKTHETLCSLRFAAKVNDCQIGIAKRTIYK